MELEELPRRIGVDDGEPLSNPSRRIDRAHQRLIVTKQMGDGLLVGVRASQPGKHRVPDFRSNLGRRFGILPRVQRIGGHERREQQAGEPEKAAVGPVDIDLIHRRQAPLPSGFLSGLGQLRVPYLEHAQPRVQTEGRRGQPAGEHLVELLSNALGGERRRPVHPALESRQRVGIDRQLEPAGEAEAPEDAEVVLGDPLRRIAHCAKNTPLQISPPLPRVDELVVGRTPRHRVDREVAAREILIDGVRVLHDRVSSIRLDVAPEGGDLEHRPRLSEDSHGPVLDAEGYGAGEHAPYLIRPRIRGQIPIFAGVSEELVADRAAHRPSLETPALERVGDLEHVRGRGEPGPLAHRRAPRKRERARAGGPVPERDPESISRTARYRR